VFLATPTSKKFIEDEGELIFRNAYAGVVNLDSNTTFGSSGPQLDRFVLGVLNSVRDSIASCCSTKAESGR
jgi:hypothetical protein